MSENTKITLWDLYLRIRGLTTHKDNLVNKPVTFFVINPYDPTQNIKMEWQQVMVDQEGTVIQLKVIP